MAGNPLYTPIFVAMGVDQLSMNSGSIPAVKRLIRELNKGDADELLTQLMQCLTHQEAFELLSTFLRDKTSFSVGIWPAGA